MKVDWSVVVVGVLGAAAMIGGAVGLVRLSEANEIKRWETCYEGQRSTWMGTCPLKGHRMVFESGEWQCRCADAGAPSP